MSHPDLAVVGGSSPTHARDREPVDLTMDDILAARDQGRR